MTSPDGTSADGSKTRAALLQERAELEREIAEYTSGANSPFPSEPHDTTDQDVAGPADSADDLEDADRNEAIVAVLRDRLAELDAALARIGPEDQGAR